MANTINPTQLPGEHAMMERAATADDPIAAATYTAFAQVLVLNRLVNVLDEINHSLTRIANNG